MALAQSREAPGLEQPIDLPCPALKAGRQLVADARGQELVLRVLQAKPPRAPARRPRRGRSTPASVAPRVVLPAPFGPRIASLSPRWRASEIPRKATGPKGGAQWTSASTATGGPDGRGSGPAAQWSATKERATARATTDCGGGARRDHGIASFMVSGGASSTMPASASAASNSHAAAPRCRMRRESPGSAGRSLRGSPSSTIVPGGIHHHHPVDQPDHAVEAMIDENDAAGGGRGYHQESAQPRGGSRREMGRGLVDYEQGSMPGQQGGKRHDLLFAARQHRRAAAPRSLGKPTPSRAICTRRSISGAAGRFSSAKASSSSTRMPQSVWSASWKYCATRGAHAPGLSRADIVAEQADAPRHLSRNAVGDEARQREQQRGLSRARWAEQQNTLAGADRQIDGSDGRPFREGIADLDRAPLRRGRSRVRLRQSASRHRSQDRRAHRFCRAPAR